MEAPSGEIGYKSTEADGNFSDSDAGSTVEYDNTDSPSGQDDVDATESQPEADMHCNYIFTHPGPGTSGCSDIARS